MNSIRKYMNIIESAQEFEWASINMDGRESDRIMQHIWKSMYPKNRLYSDGLNIDQPLWSTDPNFQITEGGFLFSTRGNEINNDAEGGGCIVSVDEGFSGNFKGVIKPYIEQCFAYMEKEWKQEYPDQPVPARKLTLYSRDGSGGAWEHIANSLGAELFDDPSH